VRGADFAVEDAMAVTKSRRVLLAALLIVACAWAAAGADDPLAAAKEFLAKYEAWHATRDLRVQRRPMPSRAECRAALPHLRAALQGGDVELRQRVINVAAWMYPLSDGFADALVDMLGDKDEEVRTRAATALAAFLPDAGIVVPALQKALADEEAAVREAAAFSLGILGPNSASARDALEKQAESDPDLRARAAAVEAVARMDPAGAGPWVLKHLESPSVECRMAAAWVARWARPGESEVPQLASALSRIVADPQADHRLRAVAFDTVDKRFSDRPEAISALQAALAAPKVAGKGRPPTFPDSVSHWRPWMEDYDTDLALRAVLDFEQWPLTPEQFTELVRPGIEGEHPQRSSLLRILAMKGKPDEKLSERLVQIVEATADGVQREWAFSALAAGPMPRDALAELAAPYARDRSAAAIRVLGDCGPAAAQHLPVLATFLGQENKYLAKEAAAAIGKIGSGSPELADTLAKAAGRGEDVWADYELRLAAAEALARCGGPGIKKLLELTADNYPDPVRDIAIRGLANGGTDALAAVPALIELMIGRMPMSAQARATLCQLGPVTGPLLAEQLRSDDPKRVYEAAIVFQCMGDQASPWLDDIFNVWLRWQAAAGQTYSSDAAGFTSAALVVLGEKALPRLLDVVDREEGRLGDRAAAMISDMDGPALLPFADRLEQLAAGFRKRHRLRCALASLYAEHPDGRARLLALMRDSELAVRIEACRMRRVKRWEGQDVVTALAEAARLETQDALTDLAGMGPAAAAALPTLLAIAQDPDRYQHSLYYLKALEPIAAMGPGEKGLELLRAALGSEDRESVRAGALATWKMPSSEAARLAPDLRATLERELAGDKPDGNLLQLLTSVLGHAEPLSEANHGLFEKLAGDARAEISRVGQAALKLEERRAERTVAWLSSEAARMVYAGRDQRGAAELLEELADTGDPRALPALRLAAACGPTEDFRALAARLTEQMR